MKRYIRASSRKEANRYSEWLKAIRRDIRNVAVCKTQEDLDNLELLHMNGKSLKRTWNERFAKMNITDFDDKIDYILDWLYDTQSYIKDRSNEANEKLSQAQSNFIQIENYLNSLATIDGYEIKESDFIVYPKTYSRDALIQFIDELIAKLGGRYCGTGRGGSWTSWNVKINNIEYQIGPTYNDNARWLIHEV